MASRASSSDSPVTLVPDVTMAIADSKEQVSDTENAAELQLLSNTDVSCYTWQNCTVEVSHRRTGQPVKILDGVSGQVHAGRSRIPHLTMRSPILIA